MSKQSIAAERSQSDGSSLSEERLGRCLWRVPSLPSSGVRPCRNSCSVLAARHLGSGRDASHELHNRQVRRHGNLFL